MNKDELKGKVNQAKGTIKQKAGELTDSPELQAEGAAERVAGKVQEGFGAAKRKVSEAIEEITDESEKTRRRLGSIGPAGDGGPRDMAPCSEERLPRVASARLC